MASVVPILAHPSLDDEQVSSPSMTSGTHDSDFIPSLYEDEDSSIPAFVLSSPLSSSWEPYLVPDDEQRSTSPPVRSTLPALAAATAMPQLSPRLSYSASADSFLPSSRSSLAPQLHHLASLPTAISLPPASIPSSGTRPTMLTIAGIHIPSPPPFVADPAAFPPAPLTRPGPTVELDGDSSSDDGVEVLRATVKRKLPLHEKREQRRRQRLEQQAASSNSPALLPPVEQIIDAEAEATADIVDLTSDNHPLLAPPTPPQPLPPPLEVVKEPLSPPVPKHTCPICLSAAEELASLKCGHVFCADCIRTAVQLTHKCPTCRAKAGLRDIRRLFM